VQVQILDHVFQTLPTPPFTSEEKQVAAERVYQHVWHQSAAGDTHFSA
jgi:type I restriction enzyme, R subunit